MSGPRMTHSPDGASAGGLDLDELEKQLRLAVRRATLVYSDGSPYGVQQAADDAWALVLRALSPSPGLGEEGIPGSPSAHVAGATATEASCDLEEAYDDAAKARDEAGFLGSVADCVHYLDAERRALEAQVHWLAETAETLRAAMREACDLLAERAYGSQARSPGHNARLVLEAALSVTEPSAEQRPSPNPSEPRT